MTTALISQTHLNLTVAFYKKNKHAPAGRLLVRGKIRLPKVWLIVFCSDKI